MQNCKHNISVEQGNQTPSVEQEIAHDGTEVKIEDLTEYQRKELATLFASLIDENRIKIDKTAGRLFSPLTSSQARELADKTKN
jgi:hypothetical protein